MTDYLTLGEVLTIHARQIRRHGGSNGIRDQGLLEAALMRPQTGYYADIIEEAAAIWESLAQNHPFVDGNKRTAFAVTYTFLRINGFLISSDEDRTYDFIISAMEAGQFRFDRLVYWLRQNTVAI